MSFPGIGPSLSPSIHGDPPRAVGEELQMYGAGSRALTAILALAAAAPAHANIPPKQGVEFPEAFVQKKRKVPSAFTYSRSLIALAKRAQATRARLASGQITPEAAAAQGGPAVTGTRSIPVLMSKFSN